MRFIEKIILHCSDTPDTMDIGADVIREWHVHDRGWLDIGYHYVVRRDGVVENGRPESKIGAHCRGHNLHSIGVCWVGRDQFTYDQWMSLLFLVMDIQRQYMVPAHNVLGHCELNSHKTCPNLDMDDIRGNLICPAP